MTKVFESSAFIIQEALGKLRPLGYEATVFQTKARMPAALKGLPDLYLMKAGVGYWIEVKARHANYMRDQVSDAQWQWFHDRRPHFGASLRYAIVEDADGLVDFVLDEDRGKHHPYDCTSIPEYHVDRYIQWRRGR